MLGSDLSFRRSATAGSEQQQKGLGLTTSMSRGALGSGIWGDAAVRQAARGGGDAFGAAAAVPPPAAAASVVVVVIPLLLLLLLLLHTGRRWLSQPTVGVADNAGGGAANTAGHSQIRRLTPPPPGTSTGDVRTRRGMTSGGGTR